VLYNEDTSEAAVRCKGVCEVKTWRLVWDGHQSASLWREDIENYVCCSYSEL
jgi:hypothetical protein